MNDTETITSLRHLLRDVHSRLLLMEHLMDRGLMDSGQLRVGVAKAARLISEYYAREEAQDERQSERNEK